jgi:hypothetical protein
MGFLRLQCAIASQWTYVQLSRAIRPIVKDGSDFMRDTFALPSVDSVRSTAVNPGGLGKEP